MPLMSWPGMRLRISSGCREEEEEEEWVWLCWGGGERVSAHPSSPRQRAVVWIFRRYWDSVGVGVGWFGVYRRVEGGGGFVVV